MPDFLFASDSLKGTLSSAQTAELLAAAARRHFPGCRTQAVPMADGGEGTAHALALAQGGRMVRAAAHDALGRPITASYALLPHGRAVIEMAAAAGLPLVAPAERNVEAASTAGVGELIKDALDRGARDVTIALGGSATNDGGMGCMRALGYRLLGAGREELAGRGCDLALVRSIDRSHADPRLARTSFTVMCDVDNPLLGQSGAARTFAPQKGADAACVERLERGMANYARVLSARSARASTCPVPAPRAAWVPDASRFWAPAQSRASGACFRSWASTGCFRTRTSWSRARGASTPRRRTARSSPGSRPHAPARACRAWPSSAPSSPAPRHRRASRRSSPLRAGP